MSIRVALTSIALLLLVPAAAFASLADEQRAGHELVAQLRSGAMSCGDLSAEDRDHIGEYVMGRALGSTSAHRSMNERMRAMMGARFEARMHQVLGARTTGCPAPGSGANAVMGPGMMGASGGSGWGAMMRSRDFGWMRAGAWRTMSRQDWQRVQRQWLSTTTSHHGRGMWTIAITLASILIVIALITLAVFARPFRRPPTASSPS